nr:MAG TPA: hypothetical protein [Caudoviricetes sp.]
MPRAERPTCAFEHRTKNLQGTSWGGGGIAGRKRRGVFGYKALFLG